MSFLRRALRRKLTHCGARHAVGRARLYLGAQSVAGAAWWIAVFASGHVRAWTLGGWNPWIVLVPDVVFFVVGSAVAAWTADRRVAAATAIWTASVGVALGVYGLVEQTAGWGVLGMTVAATATVAAAATIWFGRLPTRWFFVGPFAFRVAPEGSRARHVRRSLAQLVVFWTAFFIVVPAVLAASERRLRLVAPALGHDAGRLVAAVGFAVGSAAGLWSCVTMAVAGLGTPLPAETARNLVVKGPYRVVRNPMAVAGVAQTASVGLWLGSWTVIAVALVGAVVWHTMIRPAEERDLAVRFGAGYDRYRSEVRCWIPTVRR